LGGAVCARLAVKYPEKIKSLALVNPAGFYISGEHSIYHEIINGNNLFQVSTPEEYEVFRERGFYHKQALPPYVKEYMIRTAIKNCDWYGKIFNELIKISLVKDSIKTIEEISLNSICKDIRMPTRIFWGKHVPCFHFKPQNFRQADCWISDHYL